jgi:hypothetical protein
MTWTDPPRARAAAAGLVAFEGLAAVVAGAGFVVAALVGHPNDRPTTIVLGCLLALYGAGVLTIARGVLRSRDWSRTPAFLVQFFGLVVAWYQRGTLPALTVVLGLICVAAVVALATAQRRTSA